MTSHQMTSPDVAVAEWEAVMTDFYARVYGADYAEAHLDPEDRRFISESDVEDADAPFTRYGSDDPGRWSLHPGAHGMDSI
jgi:hypothetical protein